MRQLGRPTTPTGSAMSSREQVGSGGCVAVGEFRGGQLPDGAGVERSG